MEAAAIGFGATRYQWIFIPLLKDAE